LRGKEEATHARRAGVWRVSHHAERFHAVCDVAARRAHQTLHKGFRAEALRALSVRLGDKRCS